MILDSHVHCGLTQKFDIIKKEWEKAGIDGGVLFSPVEEIYDRYNSNFFDSNKYKSLRENVHNYLKNIAKNEKNIFVFYFVWNDFKLPDKIFKGIKWHRHSNEPEYDYRSEKCQHFIKFICENNLPVILEEEFLNTIKFIEMINKRTIIIIPHLGFLNGGYSKLKAEGIFNEQNIYVDTALASIDEIEDYAKNFDINKLLFGSDYPFGSPYYELLKIKNLFSKKEIQRIASENLLTILPS